MDYSDLFEDPTLDLMQLFAAVRARYVAAKKAHDEAEKAKAGATTAASPPDEDAEKKEAAPAEPTEKAEPVVGKHHGNNARKRKNRRAKRDALKEEAELESGLVAENSRLQSMVSTLLELKSEMLGVYEEARNADAATTGAAASGGMGRGGGPEYANPEHGH